MEIGNTNRGSSNANDAKEKLIWSKEQFSRNMSERERELRVNVLQVPDSTMVPSQMQQVQEEFKASMRAEMEGMHTKREEMGNLLEKLEDAKKKDDQKRMEERLREQQAVAQQMEFEELRAKALKEARRGKEKLREVVEVVQDLPISVLKRRLAAAETTPTEDEASGTVARTRDIEDAQLTATHLVWIMLVLFLVWKLCNWIWATDEQLTR